LSRWVIPLDHADMIKRKKDIDVTTQNYSAQADRSHEEAETSF